MSGYLNLSFGWVIQTNTDLVTWYILLRMFKTNSIKFKNQSSNVRDIFFETTLINNEKNCKHVLQVGFKSLDTIPNNILNCINYPHFKLVLKNWFYNNL